MTAASDRVTVAFKCLHTFWRMDYIHAPSASQISLRTYTTKPIYFLLSNIIIPQLLPIKFICASLCVYVAVKNYDIV